MSRPAQFEPLKLVVPYEFANTPLKKNDAEGIGAALKAMGHEVTLVDVASLEFAGILAGQRPAGGGDLSPLESYDGATVRVGLENPVAMQIEVALRRSGVAIYQDTSIIRAGSDKLRSQRIFERRGIPTPKTYCLPFDRTEAPGALSEFLDQLDPGPFVVKKAYGWSGDFVQILDDRPGAEALFRQWLAESRADAKGGVLVQEFIESNRERRRDYRIRSIVGLDRAGGMQVKIVAASIRLAKPGERLTNVTRGADKIRASLDEREAYEFYVAKKGVASAEFKRRVKNGEIEILSPALRQISLDTALAFGPGSLGLDIIVGENDKQPRALEVNPFAGGSNNFQDEHGFSVYRPWAEAFASYVSYVKNKSLNIIANKIV